MNGPSKFSKEEEGALLEFAKRANNQDGLWLILSSEGLGGATHHGEACVPLFLDQENAINFPVKPAEPCHVAKHSIEMLIEDTLFRVDTADHKIVLLDMSDIYDVDLFPVDLARFLVWAKTGIDPVENEKT